MTLDVTLTRTHQNPPSIQQASVRRDWMDDTYKKHAYKCLPLTEANVSGWEVILQQEVVVQWDGGFTVPRVLSGESMVFEIDGQTYERPLVGPSIIGIMSFYVGWTFSTPQNIATWISGSPNYFVDGAVPLTAHIPSDWWPDEFNMNWKITKIGEPVIFEAGMPFMFFQFYDTTLMPQVKFNVENYWDKPEQMQQRQSYCDAKMKKLQEQPWTWMGGIRTGLDEKGNRIGPAFDRHVQLEEPA
jgi:hypothetical protein